MSNQTFGITKQANYGSGKVSCSYPSTLSEYEKEVVQHTVNSMSFILKRGETSFPEFIEEIKKHCESNPQTEESIRVLSLVE